RAESRRQAAGWAAPALPAVDWRSSSQPTRQRRRKGRDIDNPCHLGIGASFGHHDATIRVADQGDFAGSGGDGTLLHGYVVGPMLDFNDFFYFVQVVDRGGFTAAGRTLRIPKSALSHRIQQLEANLGVRLLNRTSRQFGITDAGEEFYRHAVVMLR